MNGNDLKLPELVLLGSGKYKINVSFLPNAFLLNTLFFFNSALLQLKPETWELLRQTRQVVDDLVDQKKSIYGINTGFGKFANTVIPEDKLE